LVHAAPVYDLLLPFVTFWQENRSNRMIANLLCPREGERILDVGCGTGLLTVEIARRIQRGEVIGVDASRPMIDVARRKRGTDVCRFELAVGEDLPYENDSFDAVTSAFFFHHVGWEVKVRCAREILRVLRPGGRVIIADIDRPWTWFGKFYAYSGWILFRQAEIKENIDGRLPVALREAGIADIESVCGVLGCVRIWRGKKAL